MHNYLLRYYVAEHGIDPDTDIQIRAMPPPEMVANLRADNIDGFLAPDPVNQRAVYDGVGFIHILSKEIWDRHPCCAFAASKEFVTQTPNTYAALLKAIIDATAFAAKPENRKQIAEAIAPANYLNQPVTVVEQVLTGTFADGLGNVRTVPDRIDFDPFPWQSFAVWIMTQMKRWGQIKGDVDYAGVAQQVFLATDTAKLMKEVGLTPPAATSKTFVVMGKDVRSRQARGLHQELRHQARGLRREQCECCFSPNAVCLCLPPLIMPEACLRHDGRGTRSRQSLGCAFHQYPVHAHAKLADAARRAGLARLVRRADRPWHVATSGSGPTVKMDPEYAKLMGITATQGKSAMPGPADVGAKIWQHLKDPSTTAAPTTRASASSWPTPSLVSRSAICWPSWSPFPWAF